jgi:hypothetical protein
MPKSTQRYIGFIVVMLIAALTAGCATVGDERANILYRSSANASGGKGDFYLVQEVVTPSGGTNPIQWIVGDITNGDGVKIGDVVTDVAPSDLLANALVQEFKSVGFNVIQERTMPNDVTNGLKLKSATMKLEEVKRVTRNDATCSMKFVVELWRNGKATNKLQYESVYTDSAVTDRDELLSKAMLQTIQTLMKRAVPEIVGMNVRKSSG